MAISEENSNGFYMPVAPAGGSGYGNNFGGDWAWIILLLRLAGNGNWGFGGNGGANGSYLYPWMNQSETTMRGFQNQLLNDNITSIKDGLGDLSTAITAGFANAETAANARQIANMQSAFNAQTAMLQGFTNLGSQFANCCCENRLGLANLSADISRENCADREALNYSTRDIIASQTAGFQKILDQMCNDKIDAKNERIADLERQLTMANLAASQTAQTARLLSDNAAQTVALEQYLNPTPIPAYIVQNPNCCTSGCGCGA